MLSKRSTWMVGGLLALSLAIAPLAALAQEPLTQTFTSLDGSFSLSYPAGWVAEDAGDGTFILASSQTAMDSDTIPSGEAGLVILDANVIPLIVFEVPEQSPEGVATALAEALDAGVEIIEPESVMIGSHPAARLSFSTDMGDVLIVAIDLGNNTIVGLLGVTAVGELATFEPTMLAIAETIKYQPGWKALWQGHEDYVNSVAFSPDGTLLASASDDTTVRLWDMATGTQRATLEGHTAYVNAVAFSPDGALLASGDDEYVVRLWDVATGTERAVLEGHTDYVLGVAFSPDSAVLATASADQTVRLWDVATGTQSTTLEGHTDSVNGVAFSPDGTRIATASDDQTVRLWDATTGAQRAAIEHPDYVSSVAFNPDGTRLVSGSDDGIVRVWDAASGTLIVELVGHEDYVNSVAFSPDGRLIASGSDDNTIRLWDYELADELERQVAVLRGHIDWVNSVAFSPDGTIIASGSDDNTVRLWDVPR